VMKSLINGVLSRFGLRLVRNNAYQRVPPNLESLQSHSGTVINKIPTQWDNLSETTVQFALRDLIRPGDTAFDVGAHMGMLSIIMSRLVGPNGKVCSFEASPDTLLQTRTNLLYAAAFNCSLFHAAITTQSNQWVPFFVGDYSQSNSLLPHPGATDVIVPGLALDDFIDRYGLEPSVVKMDIEGTEFDALKGMERYLQRANPHLILEQTPSDTRCFDYLDAMGYQIIDLSTYHILAHGTDYLADTLIANIVAIHKSRLEETPYKNISKEEVAHADSSAFVYSEGGNYQLATPWQLEAGRYCILLDFDPSAFPDEIQIGVIANGVTAQVYIAPPQWLYYSYRSVVIDLRSVTSEAEQFLVNVYFMGISEKLLASKLQAAVRSATIFRIGGLSVGQAWLLS
jgi:FkbM family methyltransferase